LRGTNRARRLARAGCVAAVFAVVAFVSAGAWGQAKTLQASEAAKLPELWQWQGATVERMVVDGATYAAGSAIPGEMAQQTGAPLDAEAVRETMRRLYATGRYTSLTVTGERTAAGGVALRFAGAARYFVGSVAVTGISSEKLTSMVEGAANLQPGKAFTQGALDAAETSMRELLERNGYYESKIAAQTTTDEVNRQMNVTLAVTLGVRARIGAVTAGGDAGMTAVDFRRRAHLKLGAKVGRETTSNALNKLQRRYQKIGHLAAKVKLDEHSYDAAAHRVEYQFTANQGPTVDLVTEGVKLSKGRERSVFPVYQESAVDNDLLNEGSHNLRELLIREGYFDAQVTVEDTHPDAGHERIVYHVERGQRYKVTSVRLHGNKYFATELLKDRMQVQKAGGSLRNGRYSPALLAADVVAMENLYRANGFSAAKVTPQVQGVASALKSQVKHTKQGAITVELAVKEGAQQRFGTVALEGVDEGRKDDLRALMNSAAGQPYALATVMGDRDTLLNYYLNHGFEQVNIALEQHQSAQDPQRMDVTLHVTEGPQIFVDKVLVSGVHHTRPYIVNREVQVHAGDALDLSALASTQQRLYNLALFDNVTTAVQNPDGGAAKKDVLVQVEEAKRWDMSYGVGFEAQTGQPSTNCAAQYSFGSSQCTPEGKLGVSPRVSFDVTRINVKGRNNTLTLHTTYGLLEQTGTLTFTNPQLRGRARYGMSVSGGYSNVQNITTYQAATTQGTVKVTDKLRRQDTLIWDYTFRRVVINQSSLQVAVNLIPLLAQPDRTGGPGLTWLHDTRQPSPLDANKGSYTSVQEFLAHTAFGAQTDFNRLDASNSTYYALDKRRRVVLARNTRVGFENSFGAYDQASASANCTGGVNGPINYPTCGQIPLPERLYAGGSSSLRGFALNGAGPRDLLTGYPVGGTAVVQNTLELRFPAPEMRYVGDNLGLVLFHDMGNVFTNISDVGPAIGRVHQPYSATCGQFSTATTSQGGPVAGVCDFAYFSHTVGAGIRYKTPVGPLRVDFSYNLNPPTYPIIQDFSDLLPVPRTGQVPHFNFFFSIGQSF